MEAYIKLIVYSPLVAAVITGLFVRVIGDRPAQILTCGAMLMSAVLSAIVFKNVVLDGNVYSLQLLKWIESGDLNLSWALKVDSLTAIMFVVVTWVSAVVHVYSVGYMSHDEHQPRFMCYLSLFTFCMLMLVSGDNFLQVFFGWEGVGVCSYLLIGFWFRKDSANAAAIKAFIVNRVGDFGMILGVFAVYMLFGTLNFEQVFAAVPAKANESMNIFGQNLHALTAICLLLFVGCMGKSAQILLHTWLPDAMEGPTPVSALIHAATMVTAGVFLLARCSPMFEYAPQALIVVTVIGATTAIFAALVGLVQTDIKKSIAYSTCSQLGYMFFACGVSAYTAGIFHLVTHAFFKALLFLGAGSVIHALSGEQDMRSMGSMRKIIPFTYALMMIGTLSMIGLPMLSGAYSKGAIIESAYLSGTKYGMYAFYIGVFVAMLTAFYSFRLIFLTFHGKSRASHEAMEHAHESPMVMLLPLCLLAGGALVAGWLLEHWGILSDQQKFWGGAIFNLSHTAASEHHVPFWVHALIEGAVILGFVISLVFYVLKTGLPALIVRKFNWLYQILMHKFYFDEIYEAMFVKPVQMLGALLWKKGDEAMIDRFGPDGVAALSYSGSEMTSKTQTGYLYHYAFAMLIGLAVILGYLIRSYK